MIVDLTFLQEATDGNKELIQQLVDLFREQVDEFKGEMEDSLAENDAERLRKVAHKAKGSISALGMMDVRASLQEMEEVCLAYKGGSLKETLGEKVESFLRDIRQALSELDEYLAS